MSEEPKVIRFPKQTQQKHQKTDIELLKDIKAAQEKLVRAINAAIQAGLKVQCRVDAEDTYVGGVRTVYPKITREYE